VDRIARGGLSEASKYGRQPDYFTEDTLIVPMTRHILPDSVRRQNRTSISMAAVALATSKWFDAPDHG